MRDETEEVEEGEEEEKKVEEEEKKEVEPILPNNLGRRDHKLDGNTTRRLLPPVPCPGTGHGPMWGIAMASVTAVHLSRRLTRCSTSRGIAMASTVDGLVAAAAVQEFTGC